jgi:hypothetical protein
LNRQEHRQCRVRDLLAVEIDAASMLPRMSRDTDSTTTPTR